VNYFFLLIFRKIEILKHLYVKHRVSHIKNANMKTGLSVKGINGKCVLLLPFMYLGQLITGRSIHVLSSISLAGGNGRGRNDENNKLREAIIGAVINKKVPEAYYKTERWCHLKQSVDDFLHAVVAACGASGGGAVECRHAAGRGHNYDFLLTFTGVDGTKTDYKVEFKFNASKISDTPQFVSPMKPSQYLSSSYEEYFYDNYMAKLSAAAQMVTPPCRDIWLKQIHNNAPTCVKHLQDKYYAGCSESSQFTNAEDDVAFYNLCKTLTKDSIATFIAKNELDAAKLSQYLRESQEGKVYMLFQPTVSGPPHIALQTVDSADYTIASCMKNPSKSRYECVSETGKKIRILLRWKNGNGIAFPAFQIA